MRYRQVFKKLRVNVIKKNLQALFESFLELISPSFCINCKEMLKKENKLLCSTCFSELELISCDTRCPFCFSADISYAGTPCKECSQKDRDIDYIASAFEYSGPVKTLLHELRSNDKPYIAESLSSFLFLQITALQWPSFDYITCVPESFFRLLLKGYNQSASLAKELAQKLKVPFCTFLKKQKSILPQTEVSIAKRGKITDDTYCLKQSAQIEDKVILLVSDVYIPKKALDKCAKALREGYPKRIYALTICHGG